MVAEVLPQTNIDGEVLKGTMDLSPEESQIRKVFADSTILITGGTGFFGRLLVEKLLRSCPEVKKIYLLARAKKSKKIEERLQEQFKDTLYDRLRKERPDFIDKIGIVEGDIAELNLGLSEESRIKITNEVDVIFHGAATVRFDEEIRIAVQINVRGAREMMMLAKSCTKLRAYVHVSTAYSNCTLKEIGERFYDAPIDGLKLISLTDNLDNDMLNKITPTLLGDYPNTYIYTKAAAEDVVRKYAKGLPVVIYRPSIIISTAVEPVPGWINNVYGPTGAVLGAAIGLIHTLCCDPDAVADLVPGDMAVNCCIATAWKMAKDYPGNHEDPPLDQTPQIYNFVSSVDKPLSWRQFMNNTEMEGLKIPPENALWNYYLVMTKSHIIYELMFFYMHWIPAYLVDGVAYMLGKKPMLRKTYDKIKKFSNVIKYFGINDWKFDNANTRSLYSELGPADRRSFNFDVCSLDWAVYFGVYVHGLRVFLLKEPIENLQQARRKHFRLKIIHNTLVCFFYFCLMCACYRLFTAVF